MADKNEFFIRARYADGTDRDGERHFFNHALDAFRSHVLDSDCRVCEIWKMDPNGSTGIRIALYEQSGCYSYKSPQWHYEPGW